MPSPDLTVSEQDRFIAEALERDESRLRGFIRKRVLDTADAEDVLQDVFYELIQAYRLMKPAEQTTAWLFRVARNRIVDLFRRKKAVSLSEQAGADEDAPMLEDLLPSPVRDRRRSMRGMCCWRRLTRRWRRCRRTSARCLWRMS